MFEQNRMAKEIQELWMETKYKLESLAPDDGLLYNTHQKRCV